MLDDGFGRKGLPGRGRGLIIPGNGRGLPALTESRNLLPSFLAAAALITYSPSESIAGTESEVLVPGPDTGPPEATAIQLSPIRLPPPGTTPPPTGFGGPGGFDGFGGFGGFGAAGPVGFAGVVSPSLTVFIV